MAGRLAATVYIDGQAYGPDDDVPADVAKRIDNPKAWAEQPTSEPANEPPAGNASLEVWQEYARSKGATEDDLQDQGRDDLRKTYGE